MPAELDCTKQSNSPIARVTEREILERPSARPTAQ